MPHSQKPASRSNLFRARRKLAKSFDQKENVFNDKRVLPERWRKPTLSADSSIPNANNVPFVLSVTSSPEPGGVVESGMTIDDLTLRIKPPPILNSVAEYRVHYGKTIDGPYTVPVDENGLATVFIPLGLESKLQNEICVEWFFYGKTISVNWIIANDK